VRQKKIDFATTSRIDFDHDEDGYTSILLAKNDGEELTGKVDGIWGYPREGDEYWPQEIASETAVDDAKVLGPDADLKHGDRIMIGRTVIEVLIDAG
jgi:hypothetical protein